MKPTFRIAVIVAGFAIAAWPVLRAADDAAPAQPPPPVAGGPTAPAGQPHRRWPRAKERMEHFKRALGLSPQQCNQIAAIMKGSAPAMRAIMRDSSLSREEKHGKMHELMTGRRSEIRAILNPDQQMKFDAMRRGPRAWHDHRGWGNRPPPPAGNTPPPAPPGAPSAPASPPPGGNN